MNYGKIVNPGATPQTQPIPMREQEMVQGPSGGYAFQTTPWQQLDRFLVLGTEGGTYYASEQKLTLDNAKVVRKLIAEDGPRVVARALEISDAGRAPKNDPAIFVIAMAFKFGSVETQDAAEDAAPKVCRIGTHWLTLADNLKSLERGWGKRIARLFSRRYAHTELNKLAYDMAKYQQRGGWSQSDLVRLSHPRSKEPARNALFRWALGLPMAERSVKRKWPGHEREETYAAIDAELPEIIQTFERVKKAKTADEVVGILKTNPGLPWECVPSEFHKEKAVWGHLLHSGALPMTAMLRNLGRLSSLGVLANFNESEQLVHKLLTDEVALSRSRLHPMQILTALKTYASGRGFKGDSTWPVVPRVVEALETGFEKSFQNVTPTGKRFFVGLDVSGSMGSPVANGNISRREAGAGLLRVLMATEPFVLPMAFTQTPSQLPFTRNTGMHEMVKHVTRMDFGATDCALPMLCALSQKILVDVFIVITDNETRYGDIHPCQALQQYRKATGIPAKLVVLAMTSADRTIADPKDSGMLDIVGYDTSILQTIGEFVNS